MKTPIVLAVLALALTFASAVSAASSVTDPRHCTSSAAPPGARHAYYCARLAAITTVRATMAKRQQVARWYYPTICNEAGSLLRWSCTTIEGGQHWNLTVVYRATAAGWRVTATFKP